MPRSCPRPFAHAVPSVLVDSSAADPLLKPLLSRGSPVLFSLARKTVWISVQPELSGASQTELQAELQEDAGTQLAPSAQAWTPPGTGALRARVPGK